MDIHASTVLSKMSGKVAMKHFTTRDLHIISKLKFQKFTTTRQEKEEAIPHAVRNDCDISSRCLLSINESVPQSIHRRRPALGLPPIPWHAEQVLARHPSPGFQIGDNFVEIGEIVIDGPYVNRGI